MNETNERIVCGDGACTGTLNERGICNTCGKSFQDTRAESAFETGGEVKREKVFCGVCK